MTDVVDKATRSRMMSGIRGKNTKPEILIRSLLHRSGYRFRIHVCDLPGKPDIVFPKYNAVIFVHGCFWHGHKCHLFKWPSTRTEFWREKIGSNIKRDRAITNELLKDGWRVMRIYECALKGKTRLPVSQVIKKSGKWLEGINKNQEISGGKKGR